MTRPIELRIPDGRMAFGDVPEHIDERLQTAVRERHDPAACEAALWEAHRLGPRVLPVFFALYKFYFNQQKLEEAQRIAQIGLDAAAWELGITSDWRRLTPATTDWTAEGAARFTLFTLKALAFIMLRRSRVEEAMQILEKLAVIDAGDQVGHGVIAAMVRGVNGAEE